MFSIIQTSSHIYWSLNNTILAEFKVFLGDHWGGQVRLENGHQSSCIVTVNEHLPDELQL